MATLTELCHAHTELDSDQVSHLQNLTAIWGLLADLSFADLLLYGTDSSKSEIPWFYWDIFDQQLEPQFIVRT